MVQSILTDSIDFAKHKIDVRFEKEKPESPELEEFINSIKESGIIEPIIIRPKGATKYEVVAGNRRLNAARIAKLETIPAIVRDLTDEQAIRIAYVENIHRKNLSAIQRAKGIAAIYRLLGIEKERSIQIVKAIHNEGSIKKAYMQARIDDNNLTEEKYSEFIKAFNEIAISANNQYQSLQLICKLTEPVQEKIEETKLPQRKATLLTHSKLRDYPEVQGMLAEQIEDKTQAQAETIVRQAIGDLEEGNIERQKSGDVAFGGHADMTTPDIDQTFDVTFIDLINVMDKTVGKLIGRRLARGEYDWQPEVYKPKIEELKKNLKTLTEHNRSVMALHASVLMLVCKTIVDSAK
jgi:hypothetical protein